MEGPERKETRVEEIKANQERSRRSRLGWVKYRRLFLVFAGDRLKSFVRSLRGDIGLCFLLSVFLKEGRHLAVVRCLR